MIFTARWRGICCRNMSVCLSQAGIQWKRLNVSSKFIRHRVAHHFPVYCEVLALGKKISPIVGVHGA